jgi:hypothetical protein
MRTILYVIFILLIVITVGELAYYILNVRGVSISNNSNTLPEMASAINNVNVGLFQRIMNMVASKDSNLFQDGYIVSKLSGSVRSAKRVDNYLYLDLIPGLDKTAKDTALLYYLGNITVVDIDGKNLNVDDIKPNDHILLEITYNYKAENIKVNITVERPK